MEIKYDIKPNSKMLRRYMFLEEYYILHSKDLKNKSISMYLNNIDNYVLHEEVSIFVEIESAFKSVCQLGKDILDISNSLDISQLWKKLYNSEKIKIDKSIQNIIFNWIKENGFPYAYISLSNDDKPFAQTDFLAQLVFDSVFCYWSFKIYALFIKLKNNDDNDNENTYILNKIKKELNALNIIPILEKVEPYDIGLVGENYTLEQFIDTLKEDFSEDNYDFYLSDLINGLIHFVFFTIQDRYYDFKVTTQKPFYIDNQYSIGETCQSIMGIAYSKLLLNITSGEIGYNIRICKNPNCNDIFESRYRQEYCKKEECQRYRNNKKSYDFYHKPK